MKGILIFQDVGGKKTAITLNGLSSADTSIMSKLLGFSVILENYINARVLDYGVIRPVLQANSAFAGAVDSGVEYVSSMHKGIVTFSYVVDNETKTISLWLPSPSINQYEHVDEVGYRMLPDYGTYLRDALRTATGITDLQFNQGVIEFRDGISARPSEGAFIEFADFYLRKQYMGVSGVTDVAKLATFANALITAPGADPDAKFTQCDWRRCGVLTPEVVRRDITPATEEGWDSVTIRAELGFSWVEGSKRKTMQFTLPGPKEAIFSNPTGKTKKRLVKNATGDEIAVALTGVYGTGIRNLNFESGQCDVKNGK